MHIRTALCSAIIAVGLLSIGEMRAQTDYSSRKATGRLSVGVGAAIGVALPLGSVAEGDEVAPGFAIMAGLNTRYPFSRAVAGIFNVGIDSRGVGVRPSGQNDNRIYRATYFSLEPGVSISSFLVSLNIGLPSSLSAPEAPNGGVSSTRDVTESLQTQIEPRLGAMLVLTDIKEGWLGLTFTIGFPLNKLYKDEVALEKDISSTHAFTAHLGLTWQFAIPGTGGI